MIVEPNQWDLPSGAIPHSPSNLVGKPYQDLLVYKPHLWSLDKVKINSPELMEAFQKETAQFGENCSFDQWYNYVSSCYIYAIGDASLLVPRVCLSATVGGLSDKNFKEDSDITASTITDFALSDGLRPTGDDIRWEAGARPVALFVAKGRDYHWMRLDSLKDGSETLAWTQKSPGEDPQILWDDEGQLLRDPRFLQIPCHYGSSYRFVSFFNVPNDLSISTALAKKSLRRKGLSFLLPHEKASWSQKGRSWKTGIPVPQLG